MAVPPTDRGYVEFRPSSKRPGEMEVLIYSDLVDGTPTGLFAVHDSVPRSAIRMHAGTVLRGERSVSSSVCAVFWNGVDNVLEVTPQRRGSSVRHGFFGVSE